MQTPAANGQQQESSMATDRTNPGTNNDSPDIETSNTTSQSPGAAGEDHEDQEQATIAGQSHDGNGLYGLQAPVGKAEKKELRTLVKTAAEIIQRGRRYNDPRQMQTLTINRKISTTTTGAASREASNARVSLEPPVTKAALAELEVARILCNPKLRHDINYDPELHYRPYLDGEKGRRKIQKAVEFWNTLRSQISEFMLDPEAFQARYHGHAWTLPAALKAIGDILITLVPPEDRSTVEEALNIDLLMQQFSKGVADLEQLALWFSRTLRAHCAPMRDVWVDDMVVQLTTGNREGDIAALVQGLRMLLGIVEAMRLDVANHQIRCLRPLLIQDTVEFEQTFFLRRIALGHIDICASYDWFESHRSQTMISAFSHEGDIWVFFRGLVGLLCPSCTTEVLPDTLEFDYERIVKLRSDMLDAVNLEVCMALFGSLMAGPRPPNSLHSSASSTPSVNFADTPSSCNSSGASPKSVKLSSPSVPSPSGQVRTNLARDAGHLARPPLGDNLTWNPAPEKSHNLSSPHASATNQDKTEPNLRSALLAILDDHSSFPQAQSRQYDRWQHAAPALALEILRSTPLPLSLISTFEKDLIEQLSNPASELFQACEKAVVDCLGHIIEGYVVAWEPLGSLVLFEVAAKGSSGRWSPKRRRDDQGISENALLESVAKTAAHVGILHWKIWGEIAYAVDPNEEDYCEIEADGDVDTKNRTGTGPQPQPQPSHQTEHHSPGLAAEIEKANRNVAEGRGHETRPKQATGQNATAKPNETDQSGFPSQRISKRRDSGLGEDTVNGVLKRDR